MIKIKSLNIHKIHIDHQVKNLNHFQINFQQNL